MVKLIEKGDLYSKIAKVSILLLLCAVERGVKEKERMFFIVNFLKDVNLIYLNWKAKRKK